MSLTSYDAVVIGGGPNGLASAITLARADRSVLLVEARETVGGGMRSAEITLPGFIHDICSAVHPLAVASPFFRSIPLEEHGLEWIHPGIPMAHPFDDGTCAILDRSVDLTADSLHGDAEAYRRWMQFFVSEGATLTAEILRPLRWPRHPVTMAKFGIQALHSAQRLATRKFRNASAQGIFAGLAAHSTLPLDARMSAAFGIVLGMYAHLSGWPFPRGGAQKIADAMASYFQSLGGQIRTGFSIQTFDQLPDARVYLFDTTPQQFIRIAGDQLPARFKRKLSRYRYGPGVFKMDFALNAPIPWKAPECRHAGTVHLGGTLAEIAASEAAAWKGRQCERPFVILTQQSLFDHARAPEGKHTAWAYCHVPSGSRVDMTAQIESQIERFAPGFRDLILAKHIMTSAELEEYNPNYIGGDIAGGANMMGQFFARPVLRFPPYSAPAKHLFLCSASTPPGGGVHGMCGYHAAMAALKGL